MNTALEKDPLGVSFNALPNIFDLGNRRVKDGLSLVGLDLKKTIEDNFSNDATIDDVISILEGGHISEIAVEKVGMSYNGGDDAVSQFLAWILDKGTVYNHEYGLLNLDNKVTQVQIEKVKTHFTAQK